MEGAKAPDWPEDLLDGLAQQLTSEASDDFVPFFDAEERTTVLAPSDEAARYEADPDRYIPVEPVSTPDRLRDFVDSLEGDPLQVAILRKMRGGRGGYGQVRSILREHGREATWQAFETMEDRRLARRWLQERGLMPDASLPSRDSE